MRDFAQAKIECQLRDLIGDDQFLTIAHSISSI